MLTAFPLGAQDPTSSGETGHNATTQDTSNAPVQGVRFASGVEEIEPVKNVHDMTNDGDDERKPMEDLSPEAKEEIRNLAMTLHKSKLQESRMSNFHYEPVSLPASRVSAPCVSGSSLTSISCVSVF